MTTTPSPAILVWISNCFDKLGANPDYFPYYQRFILQRINEYLELEAMNFEENMDCFADPDDPDMGTYADWVSNHGEKFLDSFVATIEQGHSPLYADAHATNLVCYDGASQASASAYETIGAPGQPWTPDNPGYQDVMQACLAQGKDKDFAHRCAKELPDRNFCFNRAFEVTEKYDAKFAEAVSKGRSSTFAEAYANAWSMFEEVEVMALNYADCFEKLLGAVRSSDEAHCIANKYATVLEGFFYYGDEDLDSARQFDKDEALTKSESAYRFRGLPAEESKLPNIFMDVCRQKYPAEYSKQWFDEMETLARSVLAGEIKLEDIPRSPYVEFREQECLDEKSKRPPRFDLMTDEEFKSYPRKFDDEQSLWEDEAELRAQCREMELDPTDPDDRDRYNEIINETRD